MKYLNANNFMLMNIVYLDTFVLIKFCETLNKTSLFP